MYLKVSQIFVCFKINYYQNCYNCDNLKRNHWSIFGKNEIMVKFLFQDQNYHHFHIFIILTIFITDRYLNNFQEHLFGLQRLRKPQTSIFFSRENEAVKHDSIEFKVQCLEVFCYHSSRSVILLFHSIFRTTPEISSKLYFVEIC